jgi:hypothetical protein
VVEVEETIESQLIVCCLTSSLYKYIQVYLGVKFVLNILKDNKEICVDTDLCKTT